MTKTIAIIAFMLGLPSWIYLFYYDWKLALTIFLILWSNNLAQQK